MAEIIAKVIGEDFIPWIKSNVFVPLGMQHTYVEENYWNIVPGNANSFYVEEKGFANAVPYLGYMGSGNAHMNVIDLLKW